MNTLSEAEKGFLWDWFCPPTLPTETMAYVCVISKNGEHPTSVLQLKLKYLPFVEGSSGFLGLEEDEYVVRYLGKTSR